ncbi:MAG: hypothetical protein GY854_04735, partial [Deltaproteobacteria bacterium]|nr:hypothetical protein [Deltaproteobacteria bacterium]
MLARIFNQLPLFLMLGTIYTSCAPQKIKPRPRAPVPVAEKQKTSTDESSDKNLFALSEISPYFAQLLGKEAAAALLEDRLVDALELFDEIVAETSDIVVTPRARFVAAYLAERLGNNERALAELPALAEELPLLADMARERGALAALRLGKCERAIELAASVDGESTFGPDATMIRADALRSLGRLEDATDAYEGYLQQWPNGVRQFEARARIIECQALSIEEGQADDDTAEKAIELLEQLRAQAPTNRWTEIAAKHEEVFSKLEKGKHPRGKRDRKVARAAYEKASKLMRKMRNKEAERAFNRVIRLARARGKLACRARYERAIVISRQ